MSPRHRRLLPYLSLLIIWVVWGSTYLFIRIAVQEMPPFAAGFTRFMASGLVMAGVALWIDRDKGRPTPRQVFDYALVGVLLLSIGNALVMWSEKRVSSSIAALIVAAVPLYLTFFDGLRRGGQPWTGRVWMGVLVGLAGVALVARPSAATGAGHWTALIALQVATLSWTFGTLYAQSVPRKLPLASAAAIEMLAGSLVLGVFSLLAGERQSAMLEASGSAWGALAYLVTFGSLIGFTAFAYCVNELPASTVGTYAYVNPIVAVALGAIFLKEPLSTGMLAGGALIVAAVVLTTLRRQPRAAARLAEPPPASLREPRVDPVLAEEPVCSAR
jgi:drug/metabolite transporter (DMT)-like permease